jgi:hypothetical protein
LAEQRWRPDDLDAIRKRWPWVKHLFADGAYDRTQLMDKAAFLGFVFHVAARNISSELSPL